MKKLLIVIVAVAVAFASYRLGSPFRYFARTNLSGHSIAPDFSLPELTGEQFKISAYRGKVVLLDFWATWCDPCREEIPHLIELQTKYRGLGLQIVGVSMDDASEPVKFFVDAPFRGQGIGRALMETVMAEIGKLRRRTVLIHTTFYMESAIALYTAPISASVLQ